MAALQGLRGQPSRDHTFDASGSITTGGTAQLILPRAYTRTSLIIQNTSSSTIMLEFGAARATATITNGQVTAVTVTNAGFGYTRPPAVDFYGGYLRQTTSATYSIASLPDFPAPTIQPGFKTASAHCVMTGTAGSMSVSSIVIDSPGAGYIMPPFVFLANDATDPFGAALPSSTVGIELIPAGGSYTANGSVCTTDQISAYCATTSATYAVKYTL